MPKPADNTTEQPWINEKPPHERVRQAEKRINALLNYGGIHLDHVHSPGYLSLEYQQGDLSDEIGQMRNLSNAFADLADALEANS